MIIVNPFLKTSTFYRIAKHEKDIAEIPGADSNPRITEYLGSTSLSSSLSSTDQTPWCSGFANWVVTKSGVPGTNRADAVSWMNWGVPTDSPVRGSIVVFKWANGGHHVALYDSDAGNGKINVLGGNQSDKVKISAFESKYVMGYRNPPKNMLSRLTWFTLGGLGFLGSVAAIIGISLSKRSSRAAA